MLSDQRLQLDNGIQRDPHHVGSPFPLSDAPTGTGNPQPAQPLTATPWTSRCQRAGLETTSTSPYPPHYPNAPFDDVVNNDIWTRLAATALNLLAWARRLTLIGPLRKATPKTIRYRLLHLGGQLTPTGRTLHLDRDCPWTPTLLDALDRIDTLNTHPA